MENRDLIREAGVIPAPKKYSDELRERAIRMVEETLKENPGWAHKRAGARVGDQIGIPGATLRNWFRGGVAGGHAPRAVVVTDDPVARIAHLGRRCGDRGRQRAPRSANSLHSTGPGTPCHGRPPRGPSCLEHVPSLSERIKEHVALLEAITAGDADRAAELAGSHVTHVESAVRGAL